MSEQHERRDQQGLMPRAERIAEELAQVRSMDDFLGKDGVLARLFANTLEKMLDAELTEHLGAAFHAV